MRILAISGELIGASLFQQLQREGHDVKLYIDKLQCKQSLSGIVQKVDSWKKELEWVGKDGLILFDDVGYGKIRDDLFNKGYRVVGGSAESEKLELERGRFPAILTNFGIPVLPWHDFNNGQDAIEFVRENPGPWVVKQNTHYGVLNYVGEMNNGADVIPILQNYKANGLKVHLQKKAYGIEVAVGRYFNGNDWIGPVCINHEHKRLCNDDVGPLTPEMGTVVWYTDESSRLYKETLQKIKPLLQEIGYKGYFDINCIVNKNHVWPLEATARFGTPITGLQVEMLTSPLIDLLSALADGTTYEPIFTNDYGVIVSIAVPPFPLEKQNINHGAFIPPTDQILFSDAITNDNLIHINFEEVSKLQTTGSPNLDQYYWAGTNGWVMHVSGTGKTITDAQKNVYTLINQIIMPMKFYRTDIGNRVKNHDLKMLKKWCAI
jgi:phosphoribosylamine--glycine ligase